MRHAHIHVTGIVQGVGMRPFVYREAMAHGICGWVLNAGDGVHIEAHASVEALDGFVAALSEHAPAATRVEHVEVMDLAPGNWDAANEQGFRIVASQDQTAHTTLISPDIADMLRHKTGRMTVGVLARERDRGFLLRTALYHHSLAAL